jgi:hypothetical protein
MLKRYAVFYLKTNKNVPQTTVCDQVVVSNKTKLVNETYLTANFAGRIGNQMFIYAAVYGLAKTNGKKAIIDPNRRTTIHHIFQLTMNVSYMAGHHFTLVCGYI